MPRTKQRTPELRDHLLVTAVALLDRNGAGGFTTRSVAAAAGTSTPAVYELFGDKGGLLRDVFFEGFRLLRDELRSAATSDDPEADLVDLLRHYRSFILTNAELAGLMFSRPFTDFDPGPSERQASGSVRELVVASVRRCVVSGVLHGDATDIAHVLVALVQGLGSAEHARRLGTSGASVDRRWDLGVVAVLDGLRPPVTVPTGVVARSRNDPEASS